MEYLCHDIHQHVKSNEKYIKDFDKNKESWYLKYGDIKNLYGWVMSQNFPEDLFKWVENNYRFDKDFIENCIADTDEGRFF